MISGIYKDSNNFVKATFIVSLGQPFETYKELVEYSVSDSIFGTADTPKVSPQIQDLLDQANVANGPTPMFFTRRVCRDTSLGGNDAINCYYQYCENDDVLYPLFKTTHGDGGMGRVYEQQINANQQILYMTAGLPEYNSFVGFFSDAVDASLASFMNGGGRFSPSSLGSLVGTAFVGAVLLPVLPLVFIYHSLKKLGSVRITKYYDFRSEQAMYYRIVNTIIITLGTNMGLAKNGMLEGPEDSRNTGSPNSVKTSQELNLEASGGTDDNSNLPDIFGTAGWDIHRIMLKKTFYETGLDIKNRKDLSTDQYLFNQREDVSLEEKKDEVIADLPKYWSEKLWNGGMAALATLHDAHLFVGFRVEKSVDTSESFSNETGESPVKAALDSKYETVKNLKHSIANGKIIGGPIGSAIGGIFDFITGAVGSATDAIGLSGATHLLTAAGKVDIPDIWSGASSQKNYSFNINLRSYLGDPVSIFQSEYIPLAMLLALFLPRAVGTNSYTTPFLVRAYCKGQLSVPLGIIDGVTIRRGSDQHGWNYQRLPTSIDISFTIKDLSPAMYPAIGDESLWGTIIGETSAFQEYLTTLSGMGLRERMLFLNQINRRANIAITTLFNNTLNPLAWGVGVSDTMIGRTIARVIPATGLPTN